MNSGRYGIFLQILFAQLEPFSGEKNNEMTDSKMNHIHLYKEQEEEQVGGEFKEEKNFLEAEVLVQKMWKAF